MEDTVADCIFLKKKIYLYIFLHIVKIIVKKRLRIFFLFVGLFSKNPKINKLNGLAVELDRRSK